MSALETVAWRWGMGRGVWNYQDTRPGWADADPDHAEIVEPLTPLAPAQAWQARALAAEERVKVLEEALETSRHTFDAYDSPLTTDRHVAGSARQAVKRIDTALAALQQPVAKSPGTR